MPEKLGVDCPCGFTFTTPHGEEDAAAVVQFHAQRIHGKSISTREEALASVRKR